MTILEKANIELYDFKQELNEKGKTTSFTDLLENGGYKYLDYSEIICILENNYSDYELKNENTNVLSSICTDYYDDVNGGYEVMKEIVSDFVFDNCSAPVNGIVDRLFDFTNIRKEEY